jgi:predicted PurR-regulated permease PerM
MTADSAMLALCTLVAVALYLGRSIFAPVAFSLFVMAIVWPLQKQLQTRMPKLVALVLTLLLTLIVLGLFALAIAWGSSQVGQWLLRNLDRFQFIYTKMFAVFFWSFLWGIPGAFIGVPATIAILTICDQHAGSRWLAVLVSDSAARKYE